MIFINCTVNVTVLFYFLQLFKRNAISSCFNCLIIPVIFAVNTFRPIRSCGNFYVPIAYYNIKLYCYGTGDILFVLQNTSCTKQLHSRYKGRTTWSVSLFKDKQDVSR